MQVDNRGTLAVAELPDSYGAKGTVSSLVRRLNRRGAGPRNEWDEQQAREENGSGDRGHTLHRDYLRLNVTRRTAPQAGLGHLDSVGRIKG